jgi:hypoxanthine-guanine phosphoribosyltransferase
MAEVIGHSKQDDTAPFTKNSIRETHIRNIQDILDSGRGVQAIVNYIESRISTVISYERRKYERRLSAQWSTHNDKGRPGK